MRKGSGLGRVAAWRCTTAADRRVTRRPASVNGIAAWDGEQWRPLTGPNGTGVNGGYPTVEALLVTMGT